MQSKTYLITGATSGIGRACARVFAAHGAESLILTGRRADRLETIAAELRSSTCKVHTFAFDIRDPKAVEQFARSAAAQLAKLDVLVNNAGLAAGFDDFSQASFDDWEQMIDTNLKGLLYMTRAVLPIFEKHKNGHIINLGSIAGHTTYPKGAVYCATKHAVRAINESLRIDLLGKGIRVTSIDPGMVDTEFSLVRFKGDVAKAASVYKGMTPLKPEDVAEAICWAVSRPKHVNIQEMIIMPTDQATVRDVHRT